MTNSTPKTIAATENEARNVSKETPCAFCADPSSLECVGVELAPEVVADIIVVVALLSSRSECNISWQSMQYAVNKQFSRRQKLMPQTISDHETIYVSYAEGGGGE